MSGLGRATCLVLSFAVAGCSTTATVVTRDGRRDEARIIGGDREHLLLQSEYGVEKVVPRAEVKDIDHPGNVLALLGGLLAGSGALNLAVLGASCATRGATSGSTCPLLFGTMGTMTAAGAAMLVWGLWAWVGSTNAVQDSLVYPSLPALQPGTPRVVPAEPTPSPPPPSL